MKHLPIYALLVGVLMLLVVACTAAVKAAQTALDIGDAACEIVEQNYDNATVKVWCNYIDKADNASHLLTMVLPAHQAMGLKKSKTVKYVGNPPATVSASASASASK